MITEMQIEHAERRIKANSSVDDYLIIEVWEGDNLYISDNKRKKEFEFEMTKLQAIKMAKTILTSYNML